MLRPLVEECDRHRVLVVDSGALVALVALVGEQAVGLVLDDKPLSGDHRG